MAYQYPLKEADEGLKQAVWEKGREIPDFESTVWRWDKCGQVMKYDQHGKEGKHGWEIDHIKPTTTGGSDDLSNLQPLFWENNRRKGDTYPWSC